MVEYDFDNMKITLINIDSKNELIHLLSLNEKSLLIEGDYSNMYVLLKIALFDGNDEVLCGLAFQRNEYPTFIEDKQVKHSIWLNVGSNVYCIFFDKMIVEKEVALPANCWKLVLGDSGNIAAIHYLGATGIDNDGNTIWNVYGDDSLSDFEVKGGQLKLVFEDGTSKIKTI